MGGRCTCALMRASPTCARPAPKVPTTCAADMASGARSGGSLDTILAKGAPPLRERGDFARCAVVGSVAPSRGGGLGESRGAAIDAHTAVFRFNDAPTGGVHRPLVGRKTTVRVQNDVFLGWAERDGETCVGFSRGQPGSDGWAGRGRGRGGSAGGGGGRCKVLPVGDVALRLASTFWMRWAMVERASASKGAGLATPLPPRRVSAGFFGVLLALNLCARVDVYGFGSTDEMTDEDTHEDVIGSIGGSHYYNKSDAASRADRSRTPPSLRHHWDWERRCVHRVLPGWLGPDKFRVYE